MRRSSSSLLFTALFLLITFWIIWVALQEKELEEEKPIILPSKEFWSEIEGDVIRYKSYNDKGEWVLEVQAQKSEQVQGEGAAISGISAIYKKPNGKVLYILADLLKEEGPNKVFSSKAEGLITLKEEGGLLFETTGPLVITPASEFITKSTTSFKLGNWNGSSDSLYYIPETLLKLKTKVIFNFDEAKASTHITANHIFLNIEEGVGKVMEGKLNMVSPDGSESLSTTYLEAKEMVLFFAGGKNETPIYLSEIEISGQDSRIFWNEGGLISSYFSICMDESGMFPELATTSDETRFFFASMTDQTLTGTTGTMSIDFIQTQPILLTGDSSIFLESVSENGQILTLSGSKGFTTEFNRGKAENTRIFGSPLFEYQKLKGSAGFFRILHSQRKLMLSQTAELLNEEKNFQISADEILVSNWDLPDREIFGRAFIHISFQNDGVRSDGYGEEIFFSDYIDKLTLKGAPAHFERGQSSFSAKTIEVVGFQAGLPVATATGETRGTFVSDQKSYELDCQDMVFNESAGTCTMRGVKELSASDQGSLSAELVELFFSTNEKKRLKNILAQGKVHLKGKAMQDGELVHFSGQSEKLSFDASTQVLTLESGEKDVILQNDKGYESKGRRLIYSLLDATMRVEASEHGSTQTIVNIKEEKSK